MKTRVRHLAAEDVGSVRSLLFESFSPRMHPYMTYTQHGIHRFLDLRLAHASSFPGAQALVAFDELDRLVGFADFRSSEGSAFLSYICVSAQARRSGVARTLIRRLLELLPPNVTSLELDVFDESAAAVGLYASLGFHTVDRRVWISRSLPTGAEPVTIPAIKDVLASHSVYGFCDLTLGPPAGGHRFGMLGTEILRCFESGDIWDDELLGSLRASFPGLTYAFTIAPEDSVADLPRDYRVVNRSSRLELSISRGSNRSETAP